MGSATGLHHDRARLLLLKEEDQLTPAQLPLDLRLSSLVHAMDLEDGLGGIQTNHGNTHCGRLPSLQVFDNPHLGRSMPLTPSTPSVELGFQAGHANAKIHPAPCLVQSDSWLFQIM